MRILISWLAFNNDFDPDKQGMEKVKEDGPSFSFHKHFYNGYDKHILLSNQRDDPRQEFLTNKLRRSFPEHVIEPMQLPINDPIDLLEIKAKVETLLLGQKDHELDIYISPGTPAMQTAWYLCHMTLGLNTRLLQVRPARFARSKKPELIEVELSASAAPMSAVLAEQAVVKAEQREDYTITPSIKPIYAKADMVAATDQVSVLILGDTGTGKEHLARHIHERSSRRTGPYVTVNCSALSDQLLESRLFGYRKGAFTGAEKDTKGLFEEGHAGTIFLDEIGDISPYMQQALLRVLQAKEVQPIGGKSVKVDVRIMAATHKDLPKLCREGQFRWDLYYRLAVAELRLPSLLARGEAEMRTMLDHFITTVRKELNRPEKLQLTKEARNALLKHTWPGNLREMENLVRRLYVFAEGPVGLEDVQWIANDRTETSSLKLVDAERSHILKVLKLKKGNQRQTAMALGIAINTLKKKLQDYGAERNAQE